MEESLIIYCDGGSRGNPGHAASAFVVTKGGKTVFSQGKYLGVETNNVAEYTAVLFAMTWLVEQKEILNKNRDNQIIFNLDSQLVERQLNGFYKIKSPKLLTLNTKIRDLIKINNLKVKFNWGYRDKNKLADQLVNETLDKQKPVGLLKNKLG